MAKTTDGIGGSRLSGKVAGTVHERSFTGGGMRNRILPPGRYSSRQQLRAARLASLAQSWKSLTEDQRTRWNDFARSRSAPSTSPSPAPIGGFQTYIELNMMCLEAGIATSSEPPAPPLIRSFTFVVNSCSISGADLTVTMSSGTGSNPTRVLYASKPLSPGRSSFKGEPLRQLTNITGNTPVNKWSSYAATWWSLTSGYAGQIILLRAFGVYPGGLVTPTYEAIATLGA